MVVGVAIENRGTAPETVEEFKDRVFELIREADVDGLIKIVEDPFFKNLINLAGKDGSRISVLLVSNLRLSENYRMKSFIELRNETLRITDIPEFDVPSNNVMRLVREIVTKIVARRVVLAKTVRA